MKKTFNRGGVRLDLRLSKDVRMIKFSKQYREIDGTKKNTTLLSINDLPNAAFLLNKASKFLSSYEPDYELAMEGL